METPKPKFELSRAPNAPVSDEDLLADLRRVAEEIGRGTVPSRVYRERGRYSHTTLAKRYKSWNEALLAAGLSISNEFNISDEELFQNLLVLWEHIGRQPGRRECARPPSTISEGPYNRRFGSWTSALKSFVAFANSAETEIEIPVASASIPRSRRTGRDPSLRLRFKVLQRDRFSCQHCGTSPANTVGVELHLDHIVPWSKGGETTLENLRTLCADCNLGKGNLDL